MSLLQLFTATDAAPYAWSLVLAQFKPVEDYLPEDRSIKITDDRPYNEYFWLRRAFGGDDR